MSSVLTRRVGAVLELTLNRPEVLNAIDESVHAGLRDALAEAAEPSVRAVVLTGAGRGFCVGQDLREFGVAAEGVGEHVRTRFNRHVLALRALEKPVLAVVNGPAAGAGLALALACDLRIASDAATFVPGFVGIGLVPDTGGTWFAARFLGPARAFAWLVSNRALAAAEALEWGLVSEVVPAAELAARSTALAEELAALPTRAVWETKRLLEVAATSTLAAQLELEADAQEELAHTRDFVEGVGAFVEKRPPRFSGS